MTTASAKHDLDRGVYAPAEAARIVHLETRRIRRWLSGYDYLGADRVKRHSGPLLSREHEGKDLALTFMDLVEVLFVATFLHHGVTMPKIRVLQAEAQEEFSVRHPFAAKQFETDGETLFHRYVSQGAERLEDRWTHQYVAREIFNPLLKKIDYDAATHEARRYWPLGKEHPVVLDPSHSFGEATVENSHVPTRVLYNACRAGDSKLRVSRWFGVDLDEVDAAIAFEESIGASARAA